MAFKMKAGSGGPMRKNFPSAFPKNGNGKKLQKTEARGFIKTPGKLQKTETRGFKPYAPQRMPGTKHPKGKNSSKEELQGMLEGSKDMMIRPKKITSKDEFKPKFDPTLQSAPFKKDGKRMMRKDVKQKMIPKTGIEVSRLLRKDVEQKFIPKSKYTGRTPQTVSRKNIDADVHPQTRNKYKIKGKWTDSVTPKKKTAYKKKSTPTVSSKKKYDQKMIQSWKDQFARLDDPMESNRGRALANKLMDAGVDPSTIN